MFKVIARSPPIVIGVNSDDRGNPGVKDKIASVEFTLNEVNVPRNDKLDLTK